MSRTRPAALKLLLTLKRLRLDPGSALAWEISSDMTNLESAIREEQDDLLAIDERGRRMEMWLDLLEARLKTLTASFPQTPSPAPSDPANSLGSAPPSDVLDDYAREVQRLNEDGPSDEDMERYTEQAARIRHNGRQP